LSDIKLAAQNDTSLNYALKFVTQETILNNTAVLFAVEWANDPKLIVYRFYAENETHTFELVVNYLTTPLTNYTLNYQFACRANIQFNTCMGEIRWNGNLIENITPSDYKIHNSTFTVAF
jgi:hypothetical protein